MFKTGESEIFTYDGESDKLTWIESEKGREHDSPLTGCDYNSHLELLVTSDITGIIRLWTKDKKFLREIQFPDPIDSVSFLN